MRQSIRNIAILFLAILVITGCKKGDFSANSQVILFQYDHALEGQHRGFIIDSEGNVFTYNNPEEWNFPDKDFEISQRQADENIGKCEFSGKKIPGDELMKYAKYIEYIASSKVTAPRNKGDDTGTIQFICYQFSENSNLYKGHLIKIEGDYSRENLNFHSKKVISWIREIGNGVSFE